MIARHNLIALIVASSAFIQQIDSTIIVTSLPPMATSLGTEPVQLGVAIAIYPMTLAVFMPISGWFADRFGASSVFRTAIFVFMLGSALCGMSTNIVELTAARFLQGVGGAMMNPVGRLLILRATDKKNLLTAMAWLQFPARLGPIIGLPLGGFITTYFSWRWNFFINIPIGLAGIIAVTIFIDDTAGDHTRRLDVGGFVLSGLGLAALMYGLDLLGHNAIDLVTILGTFGAGMVLLYFAIERSRLHEHPLFDLSLLKFPTFTTNIAAGSLFRYGSDSMPFLLPLLFQLVLDFSPFESGMLTLAGAIGALFTRVCIKMILRRFGFRTVLIVNGFIGAASILICVFYSESTSITFIFVTLCLGGFFQSLQIISMNTLAYAEVPHEKLSAATSLAGMIQQLSSAIGIAVAAIVLNTILKIYAVSIPTAWHFHLALAVMALITMTSIPFFFRLPRDAGIELSQSSKTS
jgi:EmrB/QacA subfamily drug resistance transporter